MTKKFKELLSTYGAIALVVYYIIFLSTWAGFYIAIKSGFHVEGATGNTSTVFAAWIATKLTQPLRLLAALGLTPLVAKLRFVKALSRARPKSADQKK